MKGFLAAGPAKHLIYIVTLLKKSERKLECQGK
jgi:hypothetical protein